MTVVPPSEGARTTRVAAFALAALALGATLGEGGGHPASLLAWHGGVVALLVWIAAVAPSALRRQASFGPAAIPATLCLLLIALGALRAPYAYGALAVLIEIGCCAAVAWMAGRLGSRGLRGIVGPLQFGAAAHGVWATGQWLSGEVARPASTFLNPNHMALWLAAAVLLALGGIGVGEGRLDYWRHAALTLPALTGIVLSGSRGAAVGLAAGAAWLLWVRRAALPQVARYGLPAGLLLVIALLSVRLVERAASDPFPYHRRQIWSASVAIVAQAPWWGTGPGQFADAAANLSFPDGEGPLRYDRSFGTTHSDLLRLAAEFGLPAAGAALGAILLAVGSIAERRRCGSLPTGAAGAIAALVAIGAHGLVDNPSSWPSVYVLASALAGFLLAREGGPTTGGGLGARAALAVALAVAFVVADVRPFLAWREAHTLPRGALPDGAAHGLVRAIARNPLHPEYRLLQAEQLSAGAGWDLETYAQAREAAEQALRLHPGSARYRRGAALVEARACRTLFPDSACRARAARRFQEAEARARFDPSLPAMLAAFLLDTGDPAGARRAAERALALEPEAALPRLLLADALIDGGAPADRARASALLAEARALGARWAGWRGDTGALKLLEADAAIVARLERDLAAAAAVPARGEPGS